MDGYLIVTLIVKEGGEPRRARAVATERLNEWFTDRTLGGFAGEPNYPGALLHYSIQDDAESADIAARTAEQTST